MNNTKRLLSLDTFRGATIAAMVLVNDPGSVDHAYAQLRHAAWHGWTMTDMIFPFFLFIVGVAMTLSFSRRLAQGATAGDLTRHIIRRAAIIFCLGIFINGYPFWLDPSFSLGTLRIPGVLQRIAVCYLVSSLIFLKTSVRGTAIWAAALLAVYWLAVMLVPVPGYGAGVLQPVGNLLWYVDSHLLAGHTWIYAPATGFDPEGILSTIPAIATTLIGILTGSWLRSERTPARTTAGMLAAGVLLLAAGAICSLWLPINKNMWTSSYVLLMGGWSLAAFAVLYWIIDVRGHAAWTKPFVILGMNAIAVYVFAETLWTTLWVIHWQQADGSTMTLHEYLYNALFAPLARPVDASALFALAFVLASYAVAWIMWRKRWFLKA